MAIGRARTSRIASVGAHHELDIGGRQAVDVEQVPVAPADRLALRAATSTDRDARSRASAPARRSTIAHPTGSAAGSALDDALDLDAVLAVDLLEVDADELLARRRHVLADVVGADRQLAMAAVDEHGEADRLRPAEIDEGVHRGPDRPARVEDVVDEDDRRAIEVEGRSVPLTTGCWATSDRSSR